MSGHEAKGAFPFLIIRTFFSLYRSNYVLHMEVWSSTKEISDKSFEVTLNLVSLHTNWAGIFLQNYLIIIICPIGCKNTWFNFISPVMFFIEASSWMSTLKKKEQKLDMYYKHSKMLLKGNTSKYLSFMLLFIDSLWSNNT